MSFIHDIIKIKYTREGYLPDWPYHLISDEEMCDAFIAIPDSISDYVTDDFFGITLDKTKTTVDWYQSFIDDSDNIMYFKTNYFLIDESIEDYYRNLLNRIFYEIQEFKKKMNDERSLPDWVYSYMLGISIGPNSNKLDIHDFISSMGVDNIEDEYNLICAKQCLIYSNTWLKRLVVKGENIQRPPTMFGEPHVLKFIRLVQESLSEFILQPLTPPPPVPPLQEYARADFATADVSKINDNI